MSLIEELSGPDQVCTALEAVQDPGVDLVVVRACIGLADAIRMRHYSIHHPTFISGREILPLGAMQATVDRLWEAHGYAGYTVGPIQFEALSDSISPHVDPATEGYILAVASGSICLQERTFAGERLRDNVVTYTDEEQEQGLDIAGVRGHFDSVAFSVRFGQDGTFVRERLGGRVLRSSVELEPGDTVFFAQHPALVMHSATNARAALPAESPEGYANFNHAVLLGWHAAPHAA